MSTTSKHDRVARHSRRGSFLVFVVGVLAMLAIVTVVYVGIGRADRRGAASFEAQVQADRVPGIVRDYVVGVIRDDVFLTYPELSRADENRLSGLPLYPSASGRPAQVREVFDYPWTRVSDHSSFTKVRGDNNRVKTMFNPAGVRSDPWLASSEPTSFSLAMVKGNLTKGSVTDTTGSKPYLDRRDWMHISNFAPSGLFINLANLRGNFDAEPGIKQDDDGDDRMSRNLSLLDTSGKPTLDLPFANNTLTRDKDENEPEYWSNHQLRAFRAMIETDPRIDPADPDYIHNQWADADGDGMADSRWFELTDSRSNSLWTSPLPNDGDMRYVIAARAIDLSGRVNVNTATDFRSRPDEKFKVGSTVADIDLRRILTMQDHFDDYLGAIGYNTLALPKIPGGPNDYADPSNDVNNTATVAAGEYGFDRLRADIISPTIDFGNLLISNPNDVDAPQNFQITGGFPATGLDTYTAAQREFYGRFIAPRVAQSRFGLGSSGDYVLVQGFGAEDLLELLTYNGANDPAVTSRLERLLDGQGYLNMLGPMRSNRGLYEERGYKTDLGLTNADKPQGLSGPFPLELREELALIQSLLDPRQRMTTASGDRPLLARRYDATSSVLSSTPNESSIGLTADDLAPDAGDLLRRASVNGGKGADAGAARQRLFELYADALLPYSDWYEFSGSAWAPVSQNVGKMFRTLSYGHRGPEFALYTAAHMALNAIDAYDTDTEPSHATLLIDDDGMRKILENSALATDWKNPGSGIRREAQTVPYTSQQGTFDMSPAFSYFLDGHELTKPPTPGSQFEAAMGSLDLNDRARADHVKEPSGVTNPAYLPNRLPRSSAITDHFNSPVVNIYGIEPQPIITEVTSFFIYTDAPLGANGKGSELNEEWDFIPAGLLNPLPTLDPIGVTIDAGSDSTNPDFVAEIIAFQIHNPFLERIKLTMPDGRNGDLSTGTITPKPDVARYYIEFGGRFFELTEANIGDSTVLFPDWASGTKPPTPTGDAATLGPNETRVYFAVGEDPNNIVNRLDQINTSSPNATLPSADVRLAIWDWMGDQGENDSAGSTEQPMLMPEIDPKTGAFLSNTSKPDFFNLSGTELDQVRVAHLWRRVFTLGEDEANNTTMNDQLVDRIREPGALIATPVLDRRLTSDVLITTGVHPDPGDPSIPLGLVTTGVTDNNTGYTIAFWASITRPSGPNQSQRGVPAYMMEVKKKGLSRPQNKFGTDGASKSLLNDGDFSTDSGKKTLATFLQSSTRMTTWLNKAPWNKAAPIETNLDDTTPSSQAQLELHLNNERFNADTGVSTMRLADLLLPLGIGPMYDANPALYLPAGTTPIDGNQLFHSYEDAWTTLTEALAIAAGYTEYSNTTYENDPSTYPFGDLYYRAGVRDTTPGASGLLNKRAFDRGHLVLDDFVPYIDLDMDGLYTPSTQTNPNLAPDGDVRMGQGVPMALSILGMARTSTDGGAAALNRARAGTVNINTASVEVLRSLPMLAPPSANTLNAGYALSDALWWWPGTVHDGFSDIATTVAAYRDRLNLFPRQGIPVTTGAQVRFTNPKPLPSPGYDQRAFATDIEGIRTTPGFESIGELIAVRERDPLSGWSSTGRLHDMDRLAYDTVGVGERGVETTLYGPPGGAKTLNDNIIDDYDEQLAIANAVMNTASVGSDYFAVWFIIQGYTREDVEGLEDEDPMIPSVKRRFLVVVDRSNVIDPSDKPRIVLFKELPL